MIRSEFTSLIQRCMERKLIVAEQKARLALDLWSYARTDDDFARARKQLDEARKLYYENLEQ